jgi:hypothetical protein
MSRHTSYGSSIKLNHTSRLYGMPVTLSATVTSDSPRPRPRLQISIVVPSAASAANRGRTGTTRVIPLGGTRYIAT